MGYFYTQKHLAEFRRLVDIRNSMVKRNDQKQHSYAGVACGCGCGPFISEQETTLTPPNPPQPKMYTNRKRAKKI